MNLRRHRPAIPPFARLALGAPDMNQNTAASPSTTATASVPQPIRQPLDPRTVAAALAGIRADSQREFVAFDLDVLR